MYKASYVVPWHRWWSRIGIIDYAFKSYGTSILRRFGNTFPLIFFKCTQNEVHTQGGLNRSINLMICVNMFACT